MARARNGPRGTLSGERDGTTQERHTSEKPLRVLLVQDGPAALDVLAALRAGSDPTFEIHHVRRLAQAFDPLREGHLDAVILDLELPAAFEALRALRATDQSVALVGLSAEDDPTFRRRAFLEGAEDVIVAPFDGQDLWRPIRHAVERHGIHGAVRLQAEQHETIAEGSIQGIVIHQDAMIRYANAAIARMMGYDSPVELIGMSALAHLPPHEQARLVAMGQARMRGEPVPQQYEFDAQRRDGAMRRLECVVTPTEWQGRPATVSTMIDITERKQTEEAIRALAEVGRELVGSLGSSDGAEMIVSRLRELFGARLALLYRLTPPPEGLTCAAAFGGVAPDRWIGFTVPLGEGLAGRAVVEREPVWSPDILADPRVTMSPVVGAALRREGVTAGVAVPLMQADRAIGAIFLGDPLEHAFTRDGVRLLLAFADRAALAVERMALYERAAARAEKLAVLARVSGLIASATGSGRVLEAVSGAAISLLGATSAGVVVVDAVGRVRVEEQEREDALDSWLPTDPGEMADGIGIAEIVSETRRPVFIADIDGETRWLDREAARARGWRAYAGLPLIARDRVVGVLSIFFGTRRGFTVEEQEVMMLLADQAAIAMDNARLLRETERRRRAAEALADVGRLLAQSLDVAEVADRITDAVRGLLRATHVVLFRFRAASEDLVEVSLKGDHELLGNAPLVYPLGQGAAGLAAKERRAIVTEDVVNDAAIPQLSLEHARLEREPFRAVLAVPLMAQGRVVGALALADRTGRRFSAEDVEVVDAFATRAAIALAAAQLYEEIRNARDFLQSIAESSADAIVTADVGGHISYWSRGAEELFGYAAEEVLGRPAASLYVRGSEEARLVMSRLRAEPRIRDYETNVRAKDDQGVSVSASFSVLRAADGAIAGTVAVMKDMRERKVLEESLRQAQKMEAVGRVAGGIAHDFNNLMTVVMSRSQLLLDRLHPEDPLRRDIQLFWKTAERAAGLTRQLLAFSRRQVLQPKVLDPNAVVANMESLLRRLIGEHIGLETMLAPAPWLVKADPGQLEQVMVNLVVNARDAMPEGGRLTVETSNVHVAGGSMPAPDVPAGSYVVLSVSDTGHGMSAETRAHIFEPFFTTKEPGKGTGLGLSTVYGIVKQSGGHISVESEVGRGTTFRVYLPRVEEPRQAAETTEPPRPRPEGGTETILLVEDEADVRSVIRETLEAFGYKVMEARNGAEGLAMARGHGGAIDLLLTDVVMPEMNGPTLAVRLQAERSAMAVLFVSGYTEEAIAPKRAIEPGISFLEKPFSIQQLVRRVRDLLDARRR